MLSRVADSLFWLGRYVERAENYARFIEVNFNLSLDLPPGMKEQWEPLVATTGDKEFYDGRYKNYSKDNVIYFLAFDREYENSIIRSLEKARENARIIRESISHEAWETLNDLYYFMQSASKRKIWKKEDPRDFFDNIKQRVQIVYGLSYENESRTEGWYFNKMGKFLERADKTSRILDVKYHILLPSIDQVGSPLDYLHWAALLNSVGAFNAYKRVYGKISTESVVGFLMLNKYFPRSVFYSIKAAEDSLHKITGNPSGYVNDAEQAVGALRSELEFSDVKSIIDFGLHEYVDQLQLKLNTISNTINEQYFLIRSNFVSQTASQE